MHFYAFLLELRSAARALPQERQKPGEQFRITDRDLLLNRLELLISEASNPPDKRHPARMLEAWRTTVRLGKPRGLFERYQGNAELRAQIKQFLS